MERVFLEHQLAAGRSLEQIGAAVGKHPSTVGYWVKKHGLVAVHSERCSPKDGIERARLVELVGLGLTVAGIAAECGVSTSTAQYWLRRYGLRTLRARQAPPPEHPQPRRTSRRCLKHGAAEFILESRGYYRCTKCRSQQVAQRRRKVKEILVREAGGRCSLCGYDRHVGALQFHHVDPSQKRFTISEAGVTRSLASARVEAAKCILVCANCHAMVEAGVVSL